MITLNFSSLKVRDHWVRLVYMILFGAVIWWLIPAALIALSLLQFLHISLLSKPSPQIKTISNAACAFTYQTILYMSYHSETPPFPFTSFPDA
ncbi:MAG: DUF4389 domain-containing protein [Candidatus Comchoanobacterales bacterium]